MWELRETYKPKNEVITSAIDVVNQLDIICSKDREFFLVLYLNTRNRLIGREIVAIGTLNQANIHPREIFKGAIIHSANAVILAHNHPGGDPTPSKEDVEITHKLRQAGTLIGIEVLDHIIVAHNDSYSFVDKEEHWR